MSPLPQKKEEEKARKLAKLDLEDQLARAAYLGEESKTETDDTKDEPIADAAESMESGTMVAASTSQSCWRWREVVVSVDFRYGPVPVLSFHHRSMAQRQSDIMGAKGFCVPFHTYILCQPVRPGRLDMCPTN